MIARWLGVAGAVVIWAIGCGGGDSDGAAERWWCAEDDDYCECVFGTKAEMDDMGFGSSHELAECPPAQHKCCERYTNGENASGLGCVCWGLASISDCTGDVVNNCPGE
jgi:hypothetical protein